MARHDEPKRKALLTCGCLPHGANVVPCGQPTSRRAILGSVPTDPQWRAGGMAVADEPSPAHQRHRTESTHLRRGVLAPCRQGAHANWLHIIERSKHDVVLRPKQSGHIRTIPRDDVVADIERSALRPVDDGRYCVLSRAVLYRGRRARLSTGGGRFAKCAVIALPDRIRHGVLSRRSATGHSDEPSRIHRYRRGRAL